MHNSTGPFPGNPQPCMDHRYMSGATGFYAPQQTQPPPYHPHAHQTPQMGPHPGGFFSGGSNRQTNIIPTGGPPLMNAQYTNAFLMNCYQGAVAANGWAGVPLISTAKRRSPRHKAQATHKAIDAKDFGPGGGPNSSSMSKMALHAQGPPIILNGGGGAGAAGGHCQGPRHNRMQPPSHYRNKPHQNAHRVHQQPLPPPHHHHQLNGGQHRVLSADDSHNQSHCDRTLKLVAAADENSSILSNSSSSSSSSSSPGSLSPGGSSSNGGLVADGCLPRIIKPRKRRKKERKPGNQGSDPMDQGSGQLSMGGMHKPTTGNEDDFEDEEAVVSDFTTACSCRLCDPHSHIWSFPLRRNGGSGCSLEDCDFPDASPPPSSGIGHNGNDLYQAMNTTAALSGKSQKVQPQPRSKDVGVIGGNRVNQQRNEWRGSPPQTTMCDSAAPLDNTGLLGGALKWPCDRGQSDEDSGFDDLLFHLHRDPLDFCGDLNKGVASEDEELLIENLANLLNGSSESQSADSPKQSETETSRSDSSGVSSGSDSGSVFGECYSPLVNLGSPPSIAFHFPAATGLFGPSADNGLIGAGELLDAAAEMQKQQQQHVLNCLDMDWYRAATTNRRLLMPFSNN